MFLPSMLLEKAPGKYGKKALPRAGCIDSNHPISSFLKLRICADERDIQLKLAFYYTGRGQSTECLLTLL